MVCLKLSDLKLWLEIVSFDTWDAFSTCLSCFLLPLCLISCSAYICIPGNPVALVRAACNRWRFHSDRVIEVEGEFYLYPMAAVDLTTDNLSVQNLLKIHWVFQQWAILVLSIDALPSGKVPSIFQDDAHSRIKLLKKLSGQKHSLFIPTFQSISFFL